VTARQVAKALKDADLLMDNRTEVRSHGDAAFSHVFSGYCVVDENRFNMLPDDVFLGSRKCGWLARIYTHLISQGRWPSLAALSLSSSSEHAIASSSRDEIS
jgi:hypothetical protein